MLKAQSGICDEPNLHGLTLFCHVMTDDIDVMRRKIARIPSIIDELSDRFSEAMLNGFIAIGSEYWDILYPEQRPEGFNGFPELRAGHRNAPEQVYDLLITIRSDRYDANYLAARTLNEWLGYDIEIAENVHSFRYLDGRDLMGFVDAPDNPRGARRRSVALIEKQQSSQFEQGSYLFVQKFKHDLKRWDYLGSQRQEQIIGRDKVTAEKLPEADIVGVTHASKARLLDKNEQPIPLLRQNMAWGDTREQGTLAMYFSCQPKAVINWLKQRYFEDEQNQYDPILDYTQAVINSSFFVPSRSFLKASIQQSF
ncbi:putative iron-dependent peroxidase [Idiomarina fontislapidosi]|uniref:Peroxidase n=1 Tax=Idiomarina fontislapidosi TaxID=263723 RepID=A0A432Y2B2_9GAMM|nr:Dyp-type peroxidase [Idiomarina fontislapidosi]PYE33244.1 putative iron-dependent peroxidase [Idiomarina fontislapidosi]RUO55084.1 peroxidase [Idiomarina fontislapidosi]